MFAHSARFYDAIYSFKDYESESARVDELIRGRNPGARTLLDVACGSGKHLERLRERYEVEGLDAEPQLLEVARGRLPGVRFHHGDMRDFDLGRTFDAVTCLFSSIGYAGGEEGLRRAVASMAAHLAPGGVLVVEPWLDPGDWQEGHISLLVVELPDVKIARLGPTRREGMLSILELHHAIATVDGVEHFDERHELTLFTREQYLDAFRAAGLGVEHDPEGLIGRGLYVGVRPS